MTPTKPIMLIAEDSDIANQLAEKFASQFSIRVATSGAEAMRLITEVPFFDVAIVDIIMPVEDDKFTLKDADETGIRLVQAMLAKNDCPRFLLLTVRWDVRERIEKLISNKADHKLLLKQETTAREIDSAISTWFPPQQATQRENTGHGNSQS